jgi:hypothetical protein
MGSLCMVSPLGKLRVLFFVLPQNFDGAILLVVLHKLSKPAFEAFLGNLTRCPFKVYSIQDTCVSSRQYILFVSLPDIMNPIRQYIVCTIF